MLSINSNIKSLLNAPVIDVIASYDAISDIYICGGSLRNLLLNGESGKDIDVFVDCTQGEMTAFIGYLQHHGRVDFGQYGSPRFYPDTEANTYIDVVPFYNFTVSPEPIRTIHDLLCSFDFTANAIGLNIKTGELYDPVDGISDIMHKLIRAVRLDFPEKPVSNMISLSAVSVFWFRLLHYQHTLGFTFTTETEQWILANACRMGDLSEFSKYFFTPSISPAIKDKIQQCLHHQT